MLILSDSIVILREIYNGMFEEEINENQKNPEKIATTKGQNLQNLENIIQ